MNIDYNCIVCDYTGIMIWLPPIILIVILLLILWLAVFLNNRRFE